MNHALMLFKRFQRGTENLEPGPLPPEKKLWGPKELAGLYDPGPGAIDQQRAREDAAMQDPELQATDPGMRINIDGKDVYVPLTWPGMSDDVRDFVTSQMPPDQWPQEILDEIENHARGKLEQGKSPFEEDELPTPADYAEGTSNVGLHFYRKQLKKPKL